MDQVLAGRGANRRVLHQVRRTHEADRVTELDEPESFGCAANRLEDLLSSKGARTIHAERDVAVPRTSSAHARTMGDRWKKVRVKRGGGQRTSSTSAEVRTGPV